jgi:hypothetical protein
LAVFAGCGKEQGDTSIAPTGPTDETGDPTGPTESTGPSAEDCGDGVDNDRDGELDRADFDCIQPGQLHTASSWAGAISGTPTAAAFLDGVGVVAFTGGGLTVDGAELMAGSVETALAWVDDHNQVTNVIESTYMSNQHFFADFYLAGPDTVLGALYNSDTTTIDGTPVATQVGSYVFELDRGGATTAVALPRGLAANFGSPTSDGSQCFVSLSQSVTINGVPYEGAPYVMLVGRATPAGDVTVFGSAPQARSDGWYVASLPDGGCAIFGAYYDTLSLGGATFVDDEGGGNLIAAVADPDGTWRWIYDMDGYNTNDASLLATTSSGVLLGGLGAVTGSDGLLFGSGWLLERGFDGAPGRLVQFVATSFMAPSAVASADDALYVATGVTDDTETEIRVNGTTIGAVGGLDSDVEVLLRIDPDDTLAWASTILTPDGSSADTRFMAVDGSALRVVGHLTMDGNATLDPDGPNAKEIEDASAFVGTWRR